MKVKKLIEILQKLDQEKEVYLGNENLDEDTYYYMTQNAFEHKAYDEEFVVLTYRN